MAQRKTKYDLAEIRDVVEVLGSLYESKEIEPQWVVRKAIKQGMECLAGFGAKQAFNKLCKANCDGSSLAFSLFIIRSGPRWNNVWRLVVGSRRARAQLSTTLEKAADALEAIDQAFEQATAQDQDGYRGHFVTGSVPATREVDKRTAIPPSATAQALRVYIRFLNIVGNASPQAKIHSPDAFGKYLLSAYVKAATGDYHDVEVSALISGALREQYSEVAHRMWRLRNWKNLDKLSFPLEIQLFLGLLLAIQA